jgi:hypothetical protein
MDRTYDIFEVMPDGILEWRECVVGHEAAIARARERASKSANEFRIMHLPTKSIAAVLNSKEPPAARSDDSQGQAARDGPGPMRP